MSKLPECEVVFSMTFFGASGIENNRKTIIRTRSIYLIRAKVKLKPIVNLFKNQICFGQDPSWSKRANKLPTHPGEQGFSYRDPIGRGFMDC